MQAFLMAKNTSFAKQYFTRCPVPTPSMFQSVRTMCLYTTYPIGRTAGYVVHIVVQSGQKMFPFPTHRLPIFNLSLEVIEKLFLGWGGTVSHPTATILSFFCKNKLWEKDTKGKKTREPLKFCRTPQFNYFKLKVRKVGGSSVTMN